MAPPRLIIVGAPASGKGTQCERLKAEFKVVHLSTGDILREAIVNGTDIGMQAKSFMDKGALVPDELIVGVILQRLQEQDCIEHGWMLDGFPRTPVQAQALISAGIECDAVVFIDVPDSLLIERAVGRRLDPVTGKIYHLKYSPPQSAEVRARLLHRSDDTEAKVKVRLRAFHDNLEPILNAFPDRILSVNGDRSMIKVWNEILMRLNRMLKTKVCFVIGAPGTGKLTQSKLIEDEIGYTSISVSELFREEKKNRSAEFSDIVGECITTGVSVPSEITVQLIKRAIKKLNQKNYLIIGFPKSISDLQEWYDKMDKDCIVDYAILYEAPEGVCQDRLVLRSRNTGSTDDAIFAMVDRLKRFKKDTYPVLSAFKRLGKLRIISAASPPLIVFANTMKLFNCLRIIPPFQRTLAIIKPDAVAAGNIPSILQDISRNDLTVVDIKFVTMDSKTAALFYAEHVGKSFFPNLESFMTSGPCLVLILEGSEAVSKWRTLMGPTNTATAKATAPHSLRSLYGTDGTRNACHGSDSGMSAMREINFWYDPLNGPGYKHRSVDDKAETNHVVELDGSYKHCGVPDETTFAIIKPLAADANYSDVMSIIHGHGFNVVGETRTVLAPAYVDILYHELKDKPFYPALRRYMCSGSLVALLLERSGALQGWKYLVGSNDIEKNRKDHPYSIRALYATDGLKNVVHGSESYAMVTRGKQLFFNIGHVSTEKKSESMPSSVDFIEEDAHETDRVTATKSRRRRRAKPTTQMNIQKFGDVATYLVSDVDPIIKELVTHLMQKRPADIIGFAIKDLVEMQKNSYSSQNQTSKLAALASTKKTPINASLKISQSALVLPSIPSVGDSDNTNSQHYPNYNGAPLTADIAQLEIQRLQAVIDEISKNMKEASSQKNSSESSFVSPELIKRLSRREISLIHIGDTYNFNTSAVSKCASLISDISAASVAKGCGPALVLHSGGFLTGGSMLSTSNIGGETRKHNISILNQIGVHFGLLGFRDFEMGLPTLVDALSESRTTWLCSNLSDPFNDKAIAGTQKSVVFKWNDIPIGIFGIVGEWFEHCRRFTANEVQYLDPIETARKLCDNLRAQGAKFIICLTHCSATLNEELSSSISDIDVILGASSERYRISRTHQNSPGIINSGANFQDFSRIKMYIHDGEERPTVQWPPLRYTVDAADHSIPQHSEVASIVNTMVALDEKLTKEDTVAYADVSLNAKKIVLRTEESPLGNFIADVMKTYTESDVAILNGGFITSNSEHSAGFVKLGALCSMLTRDDVVAVLELTGAQLAKCLENGVSRVSSADGRFLQVSGLKFYYNPDDPVNYRCSNIQVCSNLRNLDGSENWSSLNPDKVYSCALPSHIAEGKDGYWFLKDLPWKINRSFCPKLKFMVLENLKERIKRVKNDLPLAVTDFHSIDPKIEERIVVVRSVYSSDAADDNASEIGGSVMTASAIAGEQLDDNQSVS